MDFFQKLPDYAKRYYESVLADYEAVPTPDPADPVAVKAKEDADRIVARLPKITWTDIYALEIAVVRLQPREKLERRVWILRLKFRQAIGEDAYRNYEASKPPDPADPKVSLAAVRADVEKILEEFHWLYTTSRARDERIRGVREFLLLIMLGMFIVLYSASRLLEVSTLAVIAMSGMAGSFMSILRRMQGVTQKPLATSDPVQILSGLDAGSVGIAISLLSGAVFATLLYMMFIAGMSGIAGNLVPEIAVGGKAGDCGSTFASFITCTGPKAGIDFAKLILWSFLSGFAEQLVPDVLDRIARTADKKDDATPQKQ